MQIPLHLLGDVVVCQAQANGLQAGTQSLLNSARKPSKSITVPSLLGLGNLGPQSGPRERLTWRRMAAMPSPLDTSGCRARGAMVARATVSAAGTWSPVSLELACLHVVLLDAACTGACSRSCRSTHDPELAGELVSHAKGTGHSHVLTIKRAFAAPSAGHSPHTRHPPRPWPAQ